MTRRRRDGGERGAGEVVGRGRRGVGGGARGRWVGGYQGEGQAVENPFAYPIRESGDAYRGIDPHIISELLW